MNKVYIDSNVLVSWQIANHPFYPQAKLLIKTLLEQNFFLCLSPLTIDEYLWAILKYQKTGYLPKKPSPQTSIRMLADLNLSYVNINWDKKTLLSIYPLIERYKLRPRDGFHLKIIKDNKIKYLASFDNDFKRIIKKGLIRDAQELIGR